MKLIIRQMGETEFELDNPIITIRGDNFLDREYILHPKGGYILIDTHFPNNFHVSIESTVSEILVSEEIKWLKDFS